MSTYGQDAVGNYQAENFVTAKSGVSDQSKSTLLTAGAQAASNAFDIYKKSKVTDFEKAQENIIQQETGVTTAQALGIDTGTDAGLKEFTKMTDRAAQLSKTSDLRTKQRIALRTALSLKEAQTARPWLANDYAVAGQKVLGSYENILTVIDAIEVQKSKDSTGGSSWRKAKIEAMMKRFGSLGIVPDKPLEYMTDDELVQEDYRSLNLSNAKVNDEKRAKEAQEARAQREEAARRRAEQRDIVSGERQAKSFEWQQIDRERTENSQKTLKSMINDYNPVYSDALAKLTQTLAKSTDPKERKAAVAAALATSVAVTNQVSNLEADLTEDDRAAFRAWNQRQQEAFKAVVSGDLSDNVATQQAVAFATNSLRMSIPEVNSFIEIWGPQAASTVVNTIFQERKDLQHTVEDAFGRSFTGKDIAAAAGMVSTGMGNRVPQELVPSAASFSLDFLKRINSDYSAMTSVMDKPTSVGNQFLYAMKHSVSAPDMEALAESGVAVVPKTFQFIDSADPAMGQEMAVEIQGFAKRFWDGSYRSFVGTELDNITDLNNRTMRYEVTDTTSPAAARATEVVKKMNNILNALETVSKYTGQPKGVSPGVWSVHLLTGGDLNELDNYEFRFIKPDTPAK